MCDLDAVADDVRRFVLCKVIASVKLLVCICDQWIQKPHVLYC